MPHHTITVNGSATVESESGGWFARIRHNHVAFAMQIALSLSVSIYCMVEAASGKKTEIFLPILTGIMGFWLPSPNSNKELRNNISNFRREAQDDRDITQSKVDEFFKIRADDRLKKKALKKELATTKQSLAAVTKTLEKLRAIGHVGTETGPSTDEASRTEAPGT